MTAPRFEPRTFRTEDRCPIPYTTVSLGKFCKKIKNVYIQGQKCPKILGGKFKSRKIQKCKVLYSQLICYSIKKSSTFDIFSIITYSALASPFHNKSSTNPKGKSCLLSHGTLFTRNYIFLYMYGKVAWRG